MAQTRKSTPKHIIKVIDGGAVVFGPASKTDCNRAARSMNKNRKSVYVQGVNQLNMAAA